MNVLEETLGDKNTFHCTQLAVWQTSDNFQIDSIDELHNTGDQTIKQNELAFLQTLSTSLVRKA